MGKRSLRKKCTPCKPCKPCKKTSKKRSSKSRRSNPWLDHIKKVRANNKKLSFKEILKLAAKNYKKK